jgi:hypothetical protein
VGGTMNRSSWQISLHTVFLAGVIGLILYLVNSGRLQQSVSHVLMLICGLLTMTIVGLIFGLFEQESNEPSLRVALSEPMAHEVLLSAHRKFAIAPSKIESPPWEVTLGQLVGVDNALAMAKLRMELERELRRVAHDIGIDVQNRPLSLSRLSHELESHEAVPPEVGMIVRDVLSISNRAVHGTPIGDEQASTVANVGAELIALLRQLPKQTDPKSSAAGQASPTRLVEFEQ